MYLMILFKSLGLFRFFFLKNIAIASLSEHQTPAKPADQRRCYSSPALILTKPTTLSQSSVDQAGSASLNMHKQKWNLRPFN